MLRVLPPLVTATLFLLLVCHLLLFPPPSFLFSPSLITPFLSVPGLRRRVPLHFHLPFSLLSFFFQPHGASLFMKSSAFPHFACFLRLLLLVPVFHRRPLLFSPLPFASLILSFSFADRPPPSACSSSLCVGFSVVSVRIFVPSFPRFIRQLMLLQTRNYTRRRVAGRMAETKKRTPLARGRRSERSEASIQIPFFSTQFGKYQDT